MTFATITSVAGAEKVTCPPGQTMDCAFTVTSDSSGSSRISLKALPEGETEGTRFDVEGAHERDLPAAGSEHVTVRISVPAGAKPGKYQFRLQAYLTDDPEKSTKSPAISVEVPKSEAPVPKDEPKKPFPWWIVAAAVVVLAIGGGLTWYLVSGGPKVPALEGLVLDKAIEALDEAGLTAGNVGEQVTGEAEAGVVLDQTPDPDTEVEKGSTVDLVIEAVSVEVPGLVGQPISEASEALAAAGLETGPISKEKRTGEKGGTVLEQEPGAGSRVLPGTPVTLTVVDEVISVASLVGQTSTEATRILSDLGLRVGRITERRTGGTPGVVLSHNPAANAKVAPGTKVNLVLEEKKVSVPRVTGQSSVSAVGLLKRAGLRPKVVHKFGGTVNKVLAQSPSAGRQVKPGSEVKITVGAKKPTVMTTIQAKQIKLIQDQVIKLQPFAGRPRVVPPAEEE